MLHIAFCEDDVLFAKQAQEEVKRVLRENHIPHSLSLFQSGNALLAAGFFDIVFMDIELDGMSGLETAKQMRQNGNDCRIIFLTSHKKYVFSAFDVAASHYLLKPIDAAKLEAVLMRIVNTLTAEKQSCCTFKCDAQVYRVPFAQILFVEVFGRKISLHTAQRVFTFNGRLDELAQTFPQSFFRCHKSYLINLSTVAKYDKETATLQNGQSVPIARRKFAEFGTAFLTFLQEGGDV